MPGSSASSVGSVSMEDGSANPTAPSPALHHPPRSPRSISSSQARVAFSPIIRSHSQASSVSSVSTSRTPSRQTSRHQSHRSNNSLGFEPRIRRRATNAVTTLDDAGNGLLSSLPKWEPGSEPTTGRSNEHLVWSHFTVVDFAPDNIEVEQNFDNNSFLKFLEQPQEEWVKCRWISVTGISTDVVSALGDKYALHELALEDLLENPANSRLRTKADWYPTHAFISLTLQYLGEKDEAAIAEALGRQAASQTTRGGISALLRKLSSRWHSAIPDLFDREKTAEDVAPPSSSDIPAGYKRLGEPQTLQQYHSFGNPARSRYMESVSALLRQGRQVMAERVFIFLTNDNTVISFFESSSQDVEDPLLRRLRKRGTVLRESCDASMMTQAIIDTVVDMAMPLTQRYAQAIEDIELDVLGGAEIEQTEHLYMCISEINKMLTFLNPIDNMVNVIRDHKTDMSQAEALLHLQDPAAGVLITPMTSTYLGDILDHCITVTEALEQLKQASENLINLIFNKTAAEQNSIIQLLTYITIIFLPLTFITGFFGQNFAPFPELDYGIGYFWEVAIPTVCVTVVLLSWRHIVAYIRGRLKARYLRDIRTKTKQSRKLLHDARTETMLASKFKR